MDSDNTQHVIQHESGGKPVMMKQKIYPVADVPVSNAVYEQENLSDKNFAAHPYSVASSWTYQGTKGIMRSLMLFPVSSIPPNISSAKLFLFGSGHDPLTRSNACHILLVKSAWEEDSVTWNTQPKVSRFFGKTIHMSMQSHQNYSVDITGWVKRWKSGLIGYGLPNFGIILKLQNEDYYTKMQFGSKKNPDSDKRPYLLIEYTHSRKK